MVVTDLPETKETGMAQERTASPSICTVQAPQAAMPQPNLVPVIFRCSRSTHKSGVLASAIVTSLRSPLTVIVSVTIGRLPASRLLLDGAIPIRNRGPGPFKQRQGGANN